MSTSNDESLQDFTGYHVQYTVLESLPSSHAMSPSPKESFLPRAGLRGSREHGTSVVEPFLLSQATLSCPPANASINAIRLERSGTTSSGPKRNNVRRLSCCLPEVVHLLRKGIRLERPPEFVSQCNISTFQDFAEKLHWQMQIASACILRLAFQRNRFVSPTMPLGHLWALPGLDCRQ